MGFLLLSAENIPGYYSFPNISQDHFYPLTVASCFLFHPYKSWIRKVKTIPKWDKLLTILLPPFYSLLPQVMVRFGSVLGLRTEESHLSVSDYVSAYAGRSAGFRLKLWRLFQIEKRGGIILYTDFFKLFPLIWGPQTHMVVLADSYLLLSW